MDLPELACEEKDPSSNVSINAEIIIIITNKRNMQSYRRQFNPNLVNL